MTYTCPNGHEIEVADERQRVECEPCDLVATWCDASNGDVYKWTKGSVHRRRCEALQDALDDAFCHQHFGEEW